MLSLALANCATPTLVDMNDVDPVAYQSVLDRCERIGTTTDVAGPLVVGAIIGATMGIALSGVIAAPPMFGASQAQGLGAAAGGVYGAGTVAVATELGKDEPKAPEVKQTVPDCLRAHGYQVLAQH